ncbi:MULTISPECIES: hypothetical protein [Pseudomonas]|jgi:hypothetical protein|uniref:hypothetical protein n=1 Tax=Pseudomonas TaxID=286 RepID=UPI0021F88399|nr:hypothetical protein [Pseudomonas putida]
MLVVICIFAVTFASFVVFNFCNGRYSRASAISSFATMIVAVGAAVVANNQLEESRVSSVKDLYKSYLEMAFANPRLSAASYPLESPVYKTFKSGEDLERYENYVGFLVFAAEEILGNDELKSERGWCETIRGQFKYHALYLSDDKYNINQNSTVVDGLIDAAVNMYLLEKKISTPGDHSLERRELQNLKSNCRV